MAVCCVDRTYSLLDAVSLLLIDFQAFDFVNVYFFFNQSAALIVIFVL